MNSTGRVPRNLAEGPLRNRKGAGSAVKFTHGKSRTANRNKKKKI